MKKQKREIDILETSPEERAKFTAEADLIKHQIKMEVMEHDFHRARLTLELESSRMEHDLKSREYKEILTSNKFHQVYDFSNPINELSVARCVNALRTWSRLDPKCHMEVVFDSPGGSVLDGFHLYDYIQTLRRAGHKVTMGSLGMAASMAGILLQAGDVRWMGAEAYVLIHEIAAGAMGKIQEIEDEVAFMRKIEGRTLDIFAARCAKAYKAGTAKHPLNKEKIKKLMNRKDCWLDSSECLDYGFVDVIK